MIRPNGNQDTSLKGAWRTYAILVGTAFAIHGWMLLNDGRYWDGWPVHLALKHGDWAYLYQEHAQGGWPQGAYIHWLFGRNPWPVFTHKLAIFIGMAGVSVMVWRIARITGFTTATESLFVAVLALAYPAYQAADDLLALNYWISYLVFLVGWECLFRAEGFAGIRHAMMRMAGLGLLLYSYMIASLLVFHFGLLVLFVLWVRREIRLMNWRPLARFLCLRIDYVVIPVVFWFVKEWLFPRHGLLTDYNQFHFLDVMMWRALGHFLMNGVWRPVDASFINPGIWLVCGLLHFMYMKPRRSGSEPFFRDDACRAMLLFGVLLLAMAMAPYVAVGKGVADRGWDTRHALLMGVPMAILWTGLIRLAVGRYGEELQRVGVVVLVSMALAFGLASARTHFAWQARWVKDRSFMENMKASAEAREASVVWVDDQYPVGGEPTYRFYEYAAMFSEMWHDESRAGFDLRREDDMWLAENRREEVLEHYRLRDFDGIGAQILVTIRRGSQANYDEILAMRYWVKRFIRPGTMDSFLRGVTELEIMPLDAGPWDGTRTEDLMHTDYSGGNEERRVHTRFAPQFE